nr:hypothetical protein GCM10017611_67970 [Rhodococcus wratislaviensis]
MSAVVALRIIRMLSGLNDRDGASADSPVDFSFATGPACPSWADAAAPSAWMVSVSLRSPGTASGRIHNCPRSVRPSGATAQ